jgi:hypothetical protein
MHRSDGYGAQLEQSQAAQRRRVAFSTHLKETSVNTYAVTLGRPGGGSPIFIIIVYRLSPAMARATATAQSR